MMIAKVTKVQQVTTRTKGKTAEWETHEAIRKQAIQRKVDELKEQAISLEEPIGSTERDSLWQALQQCQIMLPFSRLLQLVPRFTKGLNSVLSPHYPEPTRHSSEIQRTDRLWWTRVVR